MLYFTRLPLSPIYPDSLFFVSAKPILMDPDCPECFGVCLSQLSPWSCAVHIAQCSAEQTVVGIALAPAQPYCFSVRLAHIQKISVL